MGAFRYSVFRISGYVPSHASNCLEISLFALVRTTSSSSSIACRGRPPCRSRS